MVKVYISEDDGDVHFLIKSSSRKEFEDCVQIFKLNYLKYDSSTKEWFYPIRISIFTIIDALKQNDIEVDVSQDDIDVIKLSLYPPSDELKKIMCPLDKVLLEHHPILKGNPPNEDYQLKAIKKFTTNNRVMMNIYPRLGKTYISSIGIASLMKQGRLDCVLGIMRSEGLVNYKNELVFFTDGYIKEDDIVILDNNSRDIENYFNKKVILLAYNTWRLVNEYYKKERKIISKKPKKPFIQFNKWFEKRMILCDECQSICNESLQSHYTLIHSEFFERRCVMSGSVGYDYLKLYNLTKLLLPKRMSTMSRNEWWKYMTKETYSKYKRDIIPERLKEFEKYILNDIMISYGESCLPLTENYKHEVYIQMDKKMREVYTVACNDFIVEIMKQGNGKITYGNFKKKFPSLRQITDEPSLMGVPNWNIDDNSKLEVLKSILEDRIDDKGLNVILWCNYPRSMALLEKAFSKYNPIVVNGNEQLCGIKRENRADVIERIKTDENCKLLITNQVLSTSVSFWRFSVNIFWSLPLDPDYYTQCQRRIMGSGQKKNVETIHLLFEHSIDEYIFESLINKTKIKEYFDSTSKDEELPMEKLKMILNPKHKFDLEGNAL
jgi:hypothetical protein